MQGCNCFGNKTHIHNVDLVRWTKRKNRQPSQESKCLHHLELCRLGIAAVPQHNTWAENCLRSAGKKLSHHVLAELLCPRIRIVIRPLPVDRSVLDDNFISTLPSYGYRADQTEA